jgi:hypothetical protein
MMNRTTLAVLLTVFSLGVFAEGDRTTPPPFRSFTAPMLLHCVEGMEKMAEILAEYYSEAPVALMRLNVNTRSVIFSNADATTSTIVIDRQIQGVSLTCVLWSGRSTIPGGAFLVNPDPEFPETKAGQVGT